MLQILELFGGIGSPRVALRNLGVDVKAIDYVEIDEKAVRSYNAMFEKELAYRTQSVVNYNLKPDILIHGSPCQSFSIAGKQEGADEGSGTESSLMWETINIIKQMEAWKPKVVIWENVKNVLSKHMKHNFNKYLDEMQKLGYTNNYEVLNAMDFGLPQNRNRVFTISCLDGTLFNFKTLEKYPMRNIKEFLQNDVSEEYEVTQPSILKGIGTKGVNRATIIKDYAYTITERQDRCPVQVIDLGNGKYRFLTDLECWRLQGYKDDDYYSAAKVNTKRALYKQAGNSIPVTIFESIFKQLLFCNMKGVQYETNTF
ncbi:DNA cytosine methyltransferase [Clostridium butyricum]|uniref:DNA cytosine methyltransferase n=1 Tax=Clostridium butyricum TaxID=1492 RepID=UPI0009030A8A|nr:DNA cytosine methyltransferase [Clostridium butyricum]APF21679.1 DNA (cytosine-5-)-methyltransferase family protein [Clostridium butyricum]